MLTLIASLLGRRATAMQEPQATRSRPAPRTRLGVERLEAREGPAYLSFGTAYVAGAVTAANTTRADSYYLPSGSTSRTLASQSTSSVGSTYSRLAFTNNNYDTVRLELQSSVNTGNYTSGNARTNMTQYRNGGPGFVTVNVRPGAGERNGRRVLVTLSGSFLSTVSGNGTNFVHISYVNAGRQNDLLRRDTTRGGSYSSGTYSFYTTVGSSFSIHVNAQSWASGKNAVANGTAVFTINTRSV